jgi:hypothetical protein
MDHKKLLADAWKNAPTVALALNEFARLLREDAEVTRNAGMPQTLVDDFNERAALCDALAEGFSFGDLQVALTEKCRPREPTCPECGLRGARRSFACGGK